MSAKSSTDVRVSITQPAEASQGVALVQQAQGIVIQNKAQHEAAREFQKGAKSLRKKVVEHYAAIKGPLNAARTNVLDMEKRDLAPIDQAIAIAERIDTSYVREQQRIEAEAHEAARLKAEAEELARRQKEADKAEAAALKLEASSDVLSEREQGVVAIIAPLMANKSHISPSEWTRACKQVGYQDPVTAAKRLFKSEKIQTALDNAIKAQRIRSEAEAKQAEPIFVQVDAKPSEVVEGGIRAYYGCGEVDVMTLAKAVVAGEVHVLALSPNLPYLNTQAKALKELFPQAFPGCQLSRRDGTVSR